MKNSQLIFALLLFCFFKVKAQNDCTDAIVICGNTGMEGLTATGIGIQELSSSNVCSSEENNSIWFKLSIKTSGTLAFTLVPKNTNINVDFDFWLFGPNVTCSSIGQSIRCSTTNPAASGASSNHTGLSDSETDISEGPGPNGNNFVQSVMANAGDTYFLIIDRPAGSSDFSIQWTGTATFSESPNTTFPGVDLNIRQCDSDSEEDGKTPFNLQQHDAVIIGTQTDISVTYHTSLNDVITGENPISDPTGFVNTINPQKLFARATNTASGCFEKIEFMLEVMPNLTPAVFRSVTIDDLTTETNTIRVNTTGSGNYVFSLDHPDGPFQQSNLFSNIDPGIHNLYIKDPDACGIVGPIPVHVLQVPKYFTPNGDGYNDLWNIKGTSAKFNSRSSISIFDRKGKLLKKITPLDPGWDGFYNEKPMPGQDYWYHILLEDGRSSKGHFTLKR